MTDGHTRETGWLPLTGALSLALILLAVLVLLLQAGPAGAQPDRQGAPAAPGQPAPAGLQATVGLSITVEATSTIVTPGQIITYYISLAQQGGDSAIVGRLRNEFRSATLPHVDGMIVAVVGGAVPDGVQINYGSSASDPTALTWRGGLGPDSQLNITYPAEVLPCYAPDLMTIRNVVAAQIRDGGLLVDAAEIQVDCGPSVDPDKVDIAASWGAAGASCFGCLGQGDTLLPDGTGVFRIEATNSDTEPAVVGLIGAWPKGFNIGMPPTLQRVASLGFKTDDDNIGIAMNQATSQTAMFLVELAPGETEIFSLTTDLAQYVPPESDFQARLGYCLTFDGRTCPGADPVSPVPPDSVEWLPALKVHVRRRDLGDAPDSSNHFSGTSMLAYGGVPANYPTVFDPGTGPAQGPMHINPTPFHLGHRVSFEVEADVGPDQDPLNNILPPTNVANRDRRDDGALAAALNVGPCRRGLVPVRVLIRPAAVAYFKLTSTKGYLNVWYDGNKDGDWDDSSSCPGLTTAVEHVVIDHAIDVVALGPGLHQILAPTGLVPWSDQTAWVRLTLSERPANKTLNAGGISYGDGRGHAAPFLLGETEDFLLRPPGGEGAGPDMAVTLQGRSRRVVVPEGSLSDPVAPAGVDSPALEIHLTASYFKIDYRNEGSETAEDVFLTLRTPSSFVDLLGTPTFLPDDTGAVVFKQPGRIVFSLGDIEAGQAGTILATYYNESPVRDRRPDLPAAGCRQCAESPAVVPTSEVTGTASVESSSDIQAGNNLAKASFDQFFDIFAFFSSPGAQYGRTQGTTCRNTVEVRGVASPDALLNVWEEATDSDYRLIDQVTAGPDGDFFLQVELGNTLHKVAVAYADGQIADRTSAWLGIGVNNHLAWNPSSLAFIDSEGRVIQPAYTGWPNGLNFQGYLREDDILAMRVESCVLDVPPFVEGVVGGQTVTLSDPDGDGIYEGQFTTPAAGPDRAASTTASLPMSITVASDNVQSVFGGDIQTAPEGRLFDSQTGQTISGTVTLMAAAAANLDERYDIWNGDGFGQPNPQTTAADGSYAFWPEAGLYTLVATRPGYQTYRSWDLRPGGGPLNIDLPLSPAISETADFVIEIGPDGPDPAILTAPPGSVIEWVNGDIADHTATSEITMTTDIPGLALLRDLTGGPAAFDSGRLLSGDSFVKRFDGEGTYTYVDQANPALTGQIEIRYHRVLIPVVAVD